MKKIYLNPALEVVAIRKHDIIATSQTDGDNLKFSTDLEADEYGL